MNVNPIRCSNFFGLHVCLDIQYRYGFDDYNPYPVRVLDGVRWYVVNFVGSMVSLNPICLSRYVSNPPKTREL